MMLAFAFIVLITLHFFFDYSGQGDFLSKAKNFSMPIPGVPWWQAMIAHAFIQAGTLAIAVSVLFTLNGWLQGIPLNQHLVGLALFVAIVLFNIECLAHFIIDCLKCGGKITYNLDQALHITCRFLYVFAICPINHHVVN